MSFFLPINNFLKGVNLAQCLLAMNLLTIRRATSYLSKRIFFVTSNDNPTLDQAGKTAAITRAKDLGNMGVNFLPFFLNTETHKFDPGVFYEVCLFQSIRCNFAANLITGFTICHSYGGMGRRLARQSLCTDHQYPQKHFQFPELAQTCYSFFSYSVDF